MKKLLLASLLFIATVGFSQSIAVSTSPTFGCPNTTHDVSVSITNNTGSSIPPSIPYTVDITVKDDANNTLQTFSQTYSNGFANGTTKTFVVAAIPFVGPMVCTVNASATVFGSPYSQTSSYTVQYPPTLVITESAGQLSPVAAPTGYSVQYFLDGSTTAIDESISGNYTPTVDGSYTAMAYDPISGCLSQSVSNAEVVTVTAIQTADNIEVSVYPNPMTSAVTIKTQETGELSYDLVDLNGKVVRSAVFSSSTVMNAEGLLTGTYVLNISKNGVKVASYKLVK